MRNLLLALCLNFALLFGTAQAASIDINAPAAVMDFGTRPGATTYEINIQNAQHTSSEYMIVGLLNKKCFNVKDKDGVFNYLEQNGIKTTGLIDPASAKRIGEKLGVRYLVYGNVAGVTTSATGTTVMANVGGGVNVCTVKAHIIARVMDVANGSILAAVRGEGSSKSSYVALGAGTNLGNVVVLTIGTKKVTQDSVHNSIQKAAFNAAENLVNFIKGVKGKGK